MGVQDLGRCGREMDSPLKPPEGTSLVDTLTLAQRYPSRSLASKG